MEQAKWNHVTAQRQPGSALKPFVYAAALDTAVEGGSNLVTPATTVEDEPTTFEFGGRDYQPGNFEQDFRGTVTLREALAHSSNVAAVKVAETVGYQTVVNMAHRAGMNEAIQPTPAVALGSYDTTPLEIARSLYDVPPTLRRLREANHACHGALACGGVSSISTRRRPDAH